LRLVYRRRTNCNKSGAQLKSGEPINSVILDWTLH